MLIGYGDDHRSSLPAVLTSNHLVREVPRTLVPDERRAVLARRPPRPRQHPRGACCGIHAERSCHANHPHQRASHTHRRLHDEHLGDVVIVGLAIYLLTLQLNLHGLDQCRLCR